MKLLKIFEENIIQYANLQWSNVDFYQFAEYLVSIGVCDKNIIDIIVDNKDMTSNSQNIKKYLNNINWGIPDFNESSKIYTYIICSNLLRGEIDPIIGAKKLVSQINCNDGNGIHEMEMIAGVITDLDYRLQVERKSEITETSTKRNSCIEILKWAQIAFDNYKPVYEKWKSSCKGSG